MNVKLRSNYALSVMGGLLLAGCTQPTQPDPPPTQTTNPNPTSSPTPRPTATPPVVQPPPTPPPPPPATPPPPSQNARMEWSLSDGCNDGRGIGVKLFDKTNNLVWPNASQYWTAGPGGSVDVAISCQRGARICFGASTDPVTSRYWGVGLDGNRGCDSCCFTCGDFYVSRSLVCS